MPQPTYDPSLNIEWLRNHPATIVTELVDDSSIWEDLQGDEALSQKSPLEFLYLADIAALSEYVNTIPREDVAGTARDLLDTHLATHPDWWQGRSTDLHRLVLELIRDYADVCVVHGCEYADCPEGPHDEGMDI